MASVDDTYTPEELNAEMEKKGIPKATFIEVVDDFLKKNQFNTVQEASLSFEDMYRRYKYIETAFIQRRLRLLTQLPDIKKTLDVVNQLKKKNENVDVHFELASQLYAKAHIEKAEKVGLWLGANVMLEYTLDEATAVLLENQESAKKSMTETERTLEFLKEQCTTCEVNLARLHNLRVKQNK